MQYDANFSVQYDVEQPVAIRDLIESLQGVEALLRETAAFLPSVIDGLSVEHTAIKVRQVAQQSPLRELFVLTMFLAYQPDLTKNVPALIEKASGHDIPPNLDVIVTLAALMIVFYGVGAIKDFLVGRSHGPSEAMLEGLIKEVAQATGKTEHHVRSALEGRYGEKTAWKRVTSAAARVFRVSKRQNSAAVTVNDHTIPEAVVRDIPADYLFDDAKDIEPARPYTGVRLELHAQDRDHSGQGWAAIMPGIIDKRVKLKLMTGVTAHDLWNRDTVVGDVMVIYERAGPELIPKAIHLLSITE